MNVKFYPTSKGTTLYVCISVNSKYDYISLGENVFPYEIDKKNQCVSNRSKRKEELRLLIDPVIDTLESIQAGWIKVGINFSAKDLKTEYIKRTKGAHGIDQSTLIKNAFENKIQALLQNRRVNGSSVRTSKNTAGSYQTCFNRICEYCISDNINIETLTFSDITMNFLLNFKSYNDLYDQAKGNKDTTTTNLKNFKAICHEADDKDVFGVNMKAWSKLPKALKCEEYVHTILTYDQIKKMCSYVPKQKKTGPRMDLAKCQLYLDIFLFSYLSGGMALIDICYLKHESINNNNIIPTRWKTIGGFRQKKHFMSITESVDSLIEKYSGNRNSDFVFPIIDKNQSIKEQEKKVSNFSYYCNRYLKYVCKELSLPIITFYGARHAFATHALNAGVPLVDVAKMMGNSVEMIQKHYYQYTDQAQLENMKRIEAYQKKQLESA